MSVYSGPKIKTDSLKVIFDPYNNKSLVSENLILHSEDLLQSSWARAVDGAFSLDKDVLAPNNTYSAVKMVLNSGYSGNIPIYTTFSCSPLARYTVSVYVKSAGIRYAYLWFDNGAGFGCTLEIDLQTGVSRNTRIGDNSYYTSFSTTATSVGNGWHRLSISAITTSLGTSIMPRIYVSNIQWVSGNFGTPSTFGLDGTAGIYIWGWQAEQSNYATAYTKTSGAAIVKGVLDITGSGRNGTLASGASCLYPDGSMNFDGVNDIVSFNASSIDCSAEQTVIIALMPNENDGNRRNPYNHEYAGYGSITQEVNGTFSYYHGTSGGDGAIYQGTTSTMTVSQNEKAVIAISRGPSTVKWYKNGVLSNQVANSYPITVTSATTAYVGYGYAGAYSGNIYFFALYNNQLSDLEILQNYNAIRSRYGI
jgi:hypothetical protein